MLSLVYTFVGILLIQFALSAPAEAATKSYNLPKFSRIEANGRLQIDIVVGDSQSIRLSGEDAAIENLFLRVVEDTLEIDRKPNSNWQWPWKDDEVALQITVPTLLSIDAAGATKGKVSQISGSEFEISVSGTADVSLAGKVDELSLDLSGAGKIQAGELEAKRVIADIAGAGEVEVHATQLLDADVSGVGNLNFRGKPVVVKTDISGVGKVQPKG